MKTSLLFDRNKKDYSANLICFNKDFFKINLVEMGGIEPSSVSLVVVHVESMCR